MTSNAQSDNFLPIYSREGT